MSQTLQENSKTALLQASFDFVGNDNSQLSFSKGDIVQPITTLPSGWWFGHLVKDSSVSGWFPSNYFVQYQKPIQWDNEKELPQIIPSTPSAENLKSSSDAFIEPTNANLKSSSDAFIEPTNANQLPENWGIKRLSNGKHYYFNVLTNETKWSMYTTGTGQQQLDTVQEIENELSNLLIQGSDHNGELYTWPGLLGNFQQKISILLDHIKQKSKEKYLSLISSTIQSIHVLFYSSKTSSRNSSSLLIEHQSLADAHAAILNCAARLVAHGTSASQVWPAPDAESNLFQSARDLLLKVNEFVSQGQSLNLALHTLSSEEMEKLKSNSMKTCSDMMNSNQSSSSTADTISILENMMVDISTLYFSINVEASQYDSKSPISPQLVESTQKLIKMVGSFVSEIDTMGIESTCQNLDKFIDFKVDRMKLLNSVTELVMSLRKKNNSSTPDQHLVLVDSIIEAVKQVLVTIKFVLEEKQSTTQKKLKIAIVNTNSTSFPTPTSESGRSKLSVELVPLRTASIPSSANIGPKNLRKLAIDSMGPLSPAPTSPSVSSPVVSMSSFNDVRDSRVYNLSMDNAWYLQCDEDPSHVIRSDRGTIQGSTLEAIVIRMTSHLEQDESFVFNFLLTYRSICSSTRLINMLIGRFNATVPDGLGEGEAAHWFDRKLKPIRFRVYSVLKTWIEVIALDDDDDRSAIALIQEFANTTMKEHMAVSQSKIIRAIDARLSNGLASPRPNRHELNRDSGFPKRILKLKVADIDPVELARQISLLDWNLFNGIELSQLLGSVWSKENIPHVQNMQVQSNNLTGWVIYSILHGADAKKRAKMICLFIEVAEGLYSLHNYQSLNAVMIGLSNANVVRLKQTWTYVTPRHQNVLNNIRKQGSTHHLFTLFRSKNSSTIPCIPLISTILRDLEHIKNSCPRKLASDVYNCERLLCAANVLKQFESMRTETYLFNVAGDICKLLKDELSRPPYSLPELEQMSLYAEPLVEKSKAPPVNQKALANLLSSTGI